MIPCLNRDGDLLSDLVLPLFGSIAGAESVLLALDDELRPSAAMAEAPHGTAPALEGKDVANPMAMLLAGAALLHYAGEPSAGARGRSTRRCSRRSPAAIRTPDIGGHAGTTEFTDAVIAAVRRKLEAWSALGVSRLERRRREELGNGPNRDRISGPGWRPAPSTVGERRRFRGSRGPRSAAGRAPARARPLGASSPRSSS